MVGMELVHIYKCWREYWCWNYFLTTVFVSPVGNLTCLTTCVAVTQLLYKVVILTYIYKYKCVISPKNEKRENLTWSVNPAFRDITIPHRFPAIVIEVIWNPSFHFLLIHLNGNASLTLYDCWVNGVPATCMKKSKKKMSLYLFDLKVIPFESWKQNTWLYVYASVYNTCFCSKNFSLFNIHVVKISPKFSIFYLF